MDINKKQIERFFERISNHFGGNVSGKHFALWGLAFKPNTDDVREAPALSLINKLIEAGATVSAFDPEAIETTKAVISEKIQYAETAYKTLENAEALIIVTEWNEFRTPDFKKIKSFLKQPLIFDGRNLYDLDKMRGMGFTYYSIGRETIRA